MSTVGGKWKNLRLSLTRRLHLQGYTGAYMLEGEEVRACVPLVAMAVNDKAKKAGLRLRILSYACKAFDIFVLLRASSTGTSITTSYHLWNEQVEEAAFIVPFLVFPHLGLSELLTKNGHHKDVGGSACQWVAKMLPMCAFVCTFRMSSSHATDEGRDGGRAGERCCLLASLVATQSFLANAAVVGVHVLNIFSLDVVGVFCECYLLSIFLCKICTSAPP